MARFLALTSMLLLTGRVPAQDSPLGAAPPADAVPRLEFAFEERVTIAAPVVVGETMLGRRQ